MPRHLTAIQVQKLLHLKQGHTLPYSDLPGHLRSKLLADEVLEVVTSGMRKSLRLPRPEALNAYLKGQGLANNLEELSAVLSHGANSRAQMAQATGDSKSGNHRSFRGFPVNVLLPLMCQLHAQPFTLMPIKGACTFISDFHSFEIPHDVTVVGVENAENFFHVAAQAHLFAYLRPLFVSRYPQSNDLRQWLQTLPNPYLHFGDLDAAGLNIYHTEYYQHLAGRAHFFVPDNVELLFEKYGNKERYTQQTLHAATTQNPQPEVQQLIQLIQHTKKGVDQEVLIANTL